MPPPSETVERLRRAFAGEGDLCLDKVRRDVGVAFAAEGGGRGLRVAEAGRLAPVGAAFRGVRMAPTSVLVIVLPEEAAATAEAERVDEADLERVERADREEVMEADRAGR